MQTTKQERQALTHAEAKAKRLRFYDLIAFLKAEQDAAQLFQHYGKRAAQSAKQTALNDALLNGYSALVSKAYDHANDLAKRGQLLFAFHGTTALDGCDL